MIFRLVKDQAGNFRPATPRDSSLVSAIGAGEMVYANTEESLRSQRQNSRYWAGVITAAHAWLAAHRINRTKVALHEFLKQELFGLQIIEIKGKVQMTPVRSSKMSKKQFSDFTERAEHYVISEWGVPPEMIDFHHRESLP